MKDNHVLKLFTHISVKYCGIKLEGLELVKEKVPYTVHTFHPIMDILREIHGKGSENSRKYDIVNNLTKTVSD